MSEGVPIKSLRVAALSVLAIAVVAVGAALWLGSVCTISESSEHYVGTHVSIEGIQEEKGGTGSEDPAVSNLIPSSLPQSNHHTIRSTQTTDYAPEEIGDWRRKFLCDVTFADYILALFTIILAGSTGGLWWSTYKLWTAGEQQLALTKNMQTIAQQQTVILGEQTNTLIAQKEIQRQQFLAEYRPRIVIKDVYFARDDGFSDLIFELANIGGSPGKITGGFIAMNFVTDDRLFKEMSQENIETVEGIALKPGELRTIVRKTPGEIGSFLRFPETGRISVIGGSKGTPSGPLYFFGALTYVDDRGIEFGIERLSAFRRIWHQGNKHFQRTNDPDHEYAD